MPDVTKFNTLPRLLRHADRLGSAVSWPSCARVDWHGRRTDDNALLKPSARSRRRRGRDPDKLHPEILASAPPLRQGDQGGRPRGAEFAGRSTLARSPIAPPPQHQALLQARHLPTSTAPPSRAATKLGVAFDRILTAQDIGSAPSLRISSTRSRPGAHLRHQEGRHPHTAQSIFHDVVSARSVGLATMWINRRVGRRLVPRRRRARAR
jgi:hypothetical protein